MSPPPTVHVVVPQWVDGAAVPSGGDRYNSRVCAGLEAAGWTVLRHAVAGCWPRPQAGARRALAGVLAAIPDGAVVLADGIVVSADAAVTTQHADRLSLVVLVHLPLGEQVPGHRATGLAGSECRVLMAARSVITTSCWTRDRLLARYPVAPAAVTAVPPGVDRAVLSAGTAGGRELLCVATLSPHKGQDVLLDALSQLGDRPWHCRLVGPAGSDPGFVARLRGRIGRPPLAGRVTMAGPLRDADLHAAYSGADVLVVPSRGETYGMVVTEALAQGVPVIAGDVGGLPEALGHALDGQRPGLLVPPADPAALAGAVRRWLDDGDLRRELRESARGRRDSLSGWPQTARAVAAILRGAARAGGPVGTADAAARSRARAGLRPRGTGGAR